MYSHCCERGELLVPISVNRSRCLARETVLTSAPIFQEKGEEVEDVVYTTPKQIENAHLMETFDDSVAFEKNWIRSQAKKEGVDDDIAKYNGK